MLKYTRTLLGLGLGLGLGGRLGLGLGLGLGGRLGLGLGLGLGRGIFVLCSIMLYVVCTLYGALVLYTAAKEVVSVH